MRTVLLCLSLVALIASNVCGQIEASVSKYQQVLGLSSPLVVGTKVLAEKVDTISTKPVALIQVDAVGEVKVEASDIQRQDVRLAKLDDGMYLLEAPGKTWVEIKEYVEFEVNGVKRKFLSDSKTIVVELGPPGPPPPPPPPPPGSCAEKTNTNFNGLAKRSCEWVSVAGEYSSKRTELSKVYLGASEMLASGKLLTIDASSVYVKQEWSRVLTDPKAKEAWGAWSTKVNEELSIHWNNQTTNTAKRELMVQFYRSLAEGLAN